MKRILLCLIVALAALSCEKNNGWEVKNYGVFSFKEAETVVEVTPDTRSFRLEGLYLAKPDAEVEGLVQLFIVKDETTAVPGIHFGFSDSDYYIGMFSKGDNGVYYMDIDLIPENIRSEMQVVFYNVLITDDFGAAELFPHRIAETKVIFRPAV